MKYATFEECSRFYTFIIQFFFKECWILRTFNKYYYSKNLHNFVRLKYTIVRLKYTIFRRTVKFLHNQCIQFFKKCWKFCTFGEHHCLKNLHNFERSKYAIFWWAYTILHLQWTQFLEKCTLFLIFNIHNISMNVKKNL